jgi:hypothetical protein
MTSPSGGQIPILQNNQTISMDQLRAFEDDE